MDTQKQQVAQRVKEANNILVTVSNNPSVDQLAACIGLTLALNKMGKHATAVFSGQVPSTIEFLQPEKTIEKNTDSLRDFIIALDKSKADKLRYKVEDRVVKIFITPYKTSISDKDLEFSQGDFNVDVVLAIGVHNQAELDQAITSHGRILHDATVVTMNVKPGGELGSLNWLDPGASSLSELAVQLLDILDKKLMDGQIATAMLTGIVAETERFSNAKTSPQTMSISAELMALGANQQLVATKLEEPAPVAPPPAGPIAHQEAHEGGGTEVPPEAKKPDDGTLEISHDNRPTNEPAPEEAVPQGATAPPPVEPGEEAKPEAESRQAEIEEPAPPTSLIHDIKSDHNSDHDGILPPPDEHHDRHTDEHQPESYDREETHEELGQPETEAKPAGAEQQAEPAAPAAEMPFPEPGPLVPPQIRIDEHGALSPLSPPSQEPDTADEALLPPAKLQTPPTISHHNEAPKMVLAPPTLGGQPGANAPSDGFGASGDDEDQAAGLPGMPNHEMPMLGNGQGLPGSAATMNNTGTPSTPPPIPAPEAATANAPGTSFLGDQPLEEPASPSPHETLSEIERDVHSSHVTGNDAESPAGSPALTPTLAPTAPPAAPFAAPPAPQAPPMAAPQVPVVHPDDLTPDEVADAFAVADSPPAPAAPPFDPSAFNPVAEPTVAPSKNQSSGLPATGNDVAGARDAVTEAFGGGEATPPLASLQANGNPGDALVAAAQTPATPLAFNPVAGPESVAPQQAPPVQPWMPPAEAQPAAVPNPATQFDPAAFSQEDATNMPPLGPPPMGPPRMPGT